MSKKQIDVYRTGMYGLQIKSLICNKQKIIALLRFWCSKEAEI